MTYDVKHFHSAMPGAPALTGAAGSMISVLNACLLTGFGLQTVSALSVSGGIATATVPSTPSASVDSIILVAGASNALLNGEQRATAVGANSVSWATTAADGAVAGTITIKMVPAGWLQPFVGTNLATYKSADAMGTGMVLRVDDTGTTSCRVVGYESMSDITTGAGPFPSVAQMSGGGYWSKSSAANATANNWYLFADGRTFVLHVCPNSGATPVNIHGYTYGFGDALATRPGGDPYACFLAYSSGATTGDGTLDTSSAVAPKAFPRSYTGLGSSVLHYLYNNSGLPNPTATSGNDTGSFGPFPSVVDGSLRLSSRYFATAINSGPRAGLPGLYYVPMSLLFDTFKAKDKISGTGPLTGRKLFCLNPVNAGSSSSTPNTGTTGVSLVDITGPWR
jgi:hypothetical protein